MQKIIKREDVVGVTVMLSSAAGTKGCKVLSAMIGYGFSIGYELEDKIGSMVGKSEDLDEAIEMYNSIDVGGE